ncbi:dioxygenase [Dactylosporangium aurantiacum]|uniref:Dioxygenase n=1 Tax=Dactylosporangium aurantiacum TaxID=35754 RepID=A0A9Q9MK80_9ACTN|nr:carbohydrate-binding protein [Dactylosporangium aurantiacum]MDG6103195.1 dioxygenase [Dactylosporangium aurantiacum]UWZ57700.1 dioxygenase [Dactylosporangium aurantiacum]
MTGQHDDPLDATAQTSTGGPALTRKQLLRAALVAAPLPILLAGVPALARDGDALDPTPVCDDGDDETPPQMEGPYFKPDSPQRAAIATGLPGTRLTVSGYVFGTSCQPIAGALLDFWQADSAGAYDNVGYRLRGHQYTNAQGAYSLTTIVPGLYPGRTRHLHVKVQAPGRPVLTTQLYFPGEPRNATDSLYDPRLLMTVRSVAGGREATFDVVLEVPGVPPTTPPATPPSTPGGTWAVGQVYAVGAQVTYGGAAYRCLQGHTAQPGWEPPNVPALWQRL